MPIRADLMPLYPGGSIRSPQWRAIRVGILIRADWRCEACGAKTGDEHPVSGAPVQLGIAHIDHDPENNDPENLRAWCRGCHLRHDAPHHRQSRRSLGGRQPDLFPEGRCP